MEILWNKWIQDNLPPDMRSASVTALARVMLAPVISRKQEFDRWAEQTIARMARTPQTCMLRRAILEDTGIDVDIDEATDPETDFVVSAAVNDPETQARLTAVIDRYKLAGKRYRFVNRTSTATAEWTDHACEQPVPVAVTAVRSGAVLVLEADTPMPADATLSYIETDVEKPVVRTLTLRQGTQQATQELESTDSHIVARLDTQASRYTLYTFQNRL